jgi:hypothetical protein
MHRRARIGERRRRGAVRKLQDVLDVMVDPWRSPVGEHVGADLADRGLEENEVAVVDLAADLFAQELDRLVENVQSFVKPGEVGTEYKWLLGSAALRSQ